jgi:phosphoribosylformylglycinamidine synthase
VGGRPLAVTNCLNFGNPEKPAGYYQLREGVRGMGDACRALGIPVVSGNVSLYNESADGPVFPTPTVGVVGVIDDVSRHATMRWRSGDVVALLAAGAPSLGGSEYLAHLHHRTIGAPPSLDLAAEGRVQRLLQTAIADGEITTAHDCSEGGLAVALAEMAIVSAIGVTVDGAIPDGAHDRLDERWFGEAPSRVVIAGAEEVVARIQERAERSGVGCWVIGRAGGDSIRLGGATVGIAEARDRFERGLEDLS